MDKITLLCLSQFIEKFNTNDYVALFDIVQGVSEWLSKSVKIIGELGSFNDVERELVDIAQAIVQGKNVTARLCYGLKQALINMQEEMVNKFDVAIFVTDKVKLKFNKDVKVVAIEDEAMCIDTAYGMKNELKYLIYKNGENVSEELMNSVDIVINLEELIGTVSESYPIDIFTYDRLYLTAKLNQIKNQQSEILITGSSYAMVGLLEDKMPKPASNVAVNAQDLYYSLLSAKEAMKRSPKIETIVMPIAYYFFFTNMADKPSDYMLSVLSKVNYPVYNNLHGYTGKLLPLYNKVIKSPLYERLVNFEEVRDIYYEAIMRDLENLPYYNPINLRPVGGLLSYDFKEKSDEQNFTSAKVRANAHNSIFDLDKGMENQKLLDKFLDNMEELGKKVIFFIPPTTKFYKKWVLPEMVQVYNKLVMDTVNKHKCCKIIDLFNSEYFSESDFQDYDHLNSCGAEKLSKIIAETIGKGYICQ